MGGGHTSHLDESVAALGTVIRNALTRLPTEIARTTNYYRSNHGGNAPRRVILAGGGANLPYAKEFFEEKLGLPVEFFNPMRNVMVGKGVNPELVAKEAHMMGELIGLGLRGNGKAAINIDLVPSSVEAERAAEKRRPIWIASAAALTLGFLGYGILQNSAATKAEAQLADLEANMRELAKTAVPMGKLVTEEKKVKAAAEAYVKAKSDQQLWPEILTDLRKHFTSEFTWITDIEPVANFDPAKVPDDKSKVKNGDSMIKSDFAANYGASGLAAVKAPTPVATGNRRPAVTAAPAEQKANAIRIKGIWRKNDSNHNVVNTLVKALRESNPEHLRFGTIGKDGKETPLPDNVLVPLLQSTAESEDEYGWPFEIVIPLAQPVSVR